MIQNPSNILAAHDRIKPYVLKTPILESPILNSLLQHQFYFKIDALQVTGAFKIRAVLNHLLALKEQKQMPQQISAYSTGNHGIAIAYACHLLGARCLIYLPEKTAHLKVQIAKMYGAEVVHTKTRQEAEEKARQSVAEGFYFLHPSDSDLSIAGSGTLCLEALEDSAFKPDAIFASCGGGGLLAGSYLAKELLSASSLLFGSEPAEANDAFLSRAQGKLCSLKHSAQTVADGLIAPQLSARTFEYIKKLDGIFLVTEERIKYWTIWLSYLLKITIEPSCAINMDAAMQWASKVERGQKILILISGGNIDHNFYSQLWSETKWLDNLPSMHY